MEEYKAPKYNFYVCDHGRYGFDVVRRIPEGSGSLVVVTYSTLEAADAVSSVLNAFEAQEMTRG